MRFSAPRNYYPVTGTKTEGYTISRHAPARFFQNGTVRVDRVAMADESKSGADGLTSTVGGSVVPVTWEACVGRELSEAALAAVPFQKWAASLDKQLCVRSVHMQSVDKFGPRIGFIKFRADVTKDGRFVPGIVFMRGGAVAILVVLRVTRADGSTREATVLTLQPRVPIGKVAWPEIPAGMLDGDGHFAGVAAKVGGGRQTWAFLPVPHLGATPSPPAHARVTRAHRR